MWVGGFLCPFPMLFNSFYKEADAQDQILMGDLEGIIAKGNLNA